MSEIIKRIHDMHALAADACDPAYNQLLLDAADEIKWLWTEHNEWKQAAGVEAGLRREFQADNVRLRAALGPFAVYAARLDNNYTTAGYGDPCPLALSPDQPNDGAATVGDLRRARAALEQQAAPAGECPDCGEPMATGNHKDDCSWWDNRIHGQTEKP